MSPRSRPEYDKYSCMSEGRGGKAEAFARQALETTRPLLSKPIEELDVLDVGSGYGDTTIAFAKRCRTVVGIEPAGELYAAAMRSAEGIENVAFRKEAAEDLEDDAAYDLVILDNVYEHIADQRRALHALTRAMRPGAVMYLLVPNRLWPVEAHYRLPFLSWLPLSLANRYLRWSGRGHDYADASYAPTHWSLARELNRRSELDWRYTLPADLSATAAGSPWHYRLGIRVLERAPVLWAISKALLVVAVKRT